VTVRLSVCVSVTFRYCVKTAKRRITQITRHRKIIREQAASPVFFARPMTHMYVTLHRPIPPRIRPFSWGGSAPHLIQWLLSFTRATTPNGNSIGSAVFSQYSPSLRWIDGPTDNTDTVVTNSQLTPPDMTQLDGRVASRLAVRTELNRRTVCVSLKTFETIGLITACSHRSTPTQHMN